MSVEDADTGVPEGRIARFVALRFVRARRQGFLSLISVISALSFMVGVAALVIVLALMTGFQTDFVGRIFDSNAHVFVQSLGESGLIEGADALVEEIEALPGVAAAEAQVVGYGAIIGSSGVVQFTQITAVDPERAGEVTTIGEGMVLGRFDQLDDAEEGDRPGLVLGDSLAATLGVFPGDVVQLLVPRMRLTPWGAKLRQPVFRITGTFETGHHEYDSAWSFISLEEGQRVFDTGDAVMRVAARVEDIHEVEVVKERVAEALGAGYLVQSVLDNSRAYFAALKLEKLMMFCALTMIVIVAAMGVVSALVLTVTQKVREIGVLLALGTSRATILRIFVIQGFWMGALGTFLGAALGAGIAITLHRTQAIKLDPGIYLLDHLPFLVEPTDFVSVIVVSLVISLIATIYPAWRAASLDPVEALRRD